MFVLGLQIELNDLIGVLESDKPESWGGREQKLNGLLIFISEEFTYF